MPFIKSLIFKRVAYCFKLIAVILLFGKIMPPCFCCVEKGLVYIIITTLFSYQPSSCSKYTKVNIQSSCNVHLVFNIKYIFAAYWRIACLALFYTY